MMPMMKWWYFTFELNKTEIVYDWKSCTRWISTENRYRMSSLSIRPWICGYNLRPRRVRWKLRGMGTYCYVKRSSVYVRVATCSKKKVNRITCVKRTFPRVSQWITTILYQPRTSWWDPKRSFWSRSQYTTFTQAVCGKVTVYCLHQLHGYSIKGSNK